MKQFAVGGLQKVRLFEIATTIVELGFNCVRLPYSLALYFKNPVVSDDAVVANPELKGKKALDVFDATVSALSSVGVLTILNNHGSAAGWCCKLESEEGVWSNSIYNLEEWIEVNQKLAERYKNDPFVVGTDLRNEIHDFAPSLLVTWGSGSNDGNTDWKVAVELAADAVYEVNPDLLIIVSGLCFSYDLRMLHSDPPTLKQKDKLVWTVHTYSFSLWWVDWEQNFLKEQYNLSYEKLENIGFISFLLVASSSFVLLLFDVYYRKKVAKPRGKHLCFLDELFCNLGAVEILCTLLGWSLLSSAVLNLIENAVRDGYASAGCANVSYEADDVNLIKWVFLILSIAAIISIIIILSLCRNTKGEKRNVELTEMSFKNLNSKKLEQQNPISIMESDENEITANRVGSAVNLNSSTENTPSRFVSSKEKSNCNCKNCVFLNCFLIWTLLGLFGSFFLYHFCGKVQTYSFFHDELYSKWEPETTKHPVWIGEFGTDLDASWFPGVGNDWLYWVTHFIDTYEMSWAYWPLNPDKVTPDLENPLNNWKITEDFYSILSKNWIDPRFPNVVGLLKTINHYD
eukprot:g6240.t1